MIRIENVQVNGLEPAIRGMRNPMNSWDKSDSYIQCLEYDKLSDDKNKTYLIDEYTVGARDRELMMNLARGGPVHAKYRRMIIVYVDITAPLYWWKEFDTYKIGTVSNSCSTMYKIHDKEFTLEDFSHEHLESFDPEFNGYDVLNSVVNALNSARDAFLRTSAKRHWWQMIQLLPSSYNQKRTVMLNYEVLASIYPMRRNHKLDEWLEFCKWIETLPCSEIITVEEES